MLSSAFLSGVVGKSEVAIEKSEVGSRKSEVGRPFSAFVVNKSANKCANKTAFFNSLESRAQFEIP